MSLYSITYGLVIGALFLPLIIETKPIEGNDDENDKRED